MRDGRDAPKPKPKPTPKLSPPEAWEPDSWVDEGPVRRAAGAAVSRARQATDAKKPEPQRRRASHGLPGDVVGELTRTVGEARAAKLVDRLDDARRAFERERYLDAKRMLATVVKEAPGAAAVRELNGLTLYRLERYRSAATELDAYANLSGAVDQHPVLADCYRALRKWAKVDELWAELRDASPSAELVAEGRIVMAGSLADRGDLDAAIELLSRAPRPKGKVRTHHLREWYAQADLLDRAGDTPRARRLFEQIIVNDRDFADTAERLASLGT